jgi:2-keto-4-pentenoate hydratase/2-oxohepta-3-ene-1,7-dioic acid hydratase in catechol pathway
MRLATVTGASGEALAICRKTGAVVITDLNRALHQRWPGTMEQMLQSGQLEEMANWYRDEGQEALDEKRIVDLVRNRVVYAPLYRHPPKIWGIGLNYVAHAEDLSEKAPTSAPASFMKPDTTIIGPGDTIQIPALSDKTTAEAELGVIIGRRCKDVPRERWLDVVAGFTTILDMTAEDILRQNPRYLTMSKSFDTFFSFGPQLVTPDEIEDVFRLTVSTVINGRVHAENSVDRMTFPPDALIAYHSRVMTLVPGDIISTGTPGAVPIRHGDRVECRISGFEPLRNAVIDVKQS